MNGKRIFNRYEIQQELGTGGMATVYFAIDTRFQRSVAVKILPPEMLHQSTYADRFAREAQTIATLQHPSIVPIHDYGEQDGQLFMIMAYMAGGSLADRIKQGPLPQTEVLSTIERVAEALDAAHTRLVIHRDVKPPNILFDEYGYAYLSDFGIVKLGDDTAHLTASDVIGTPAYMAPEMVGNETLTHAIDVYGLAVTLFEMLTGEQPYQTVTPMSVLMAHMNDPIPQVHNLRPDLPEAVQSVIDKGMAKDPAERYAHAGDLSVDLRNTFASHIVPAPSPLPAVTDEPAGTPVDNITAQLASQRGRRLGWLVPVGGALAALPLLAILVLGWIFFNDRGDATPVATPVAVAKQTSQPIATSEAASEGSLATTATASPTSMPTPTAIPQPDSRYVLPANAWTRLGRGSFDAIALSPDESLLAIAASVGVYVYRFDSFDLVWYGQTPDWQASIAWSPDGTRLATASWDGVIRLWDVGEGTMLDTLEEHESIVQTLAWSPDGTLLASGSGDSNIILWNVPTSESVYLLEDHQLWINSIAWSPDGSRLASASADGTIIVWNPASGSALRTMKGEFPIPFSSVAWSPDGTRLASGSWDDSITVWNAATGQSLQTLESHAFYVSSVAWSPDGAQLASGSWDNTAIVWDTNTGEVVQELEGHTHGLLGVTWLSDGTSVLSSGLDGKVMLWEAEQGEVLRALQDHNTVVGRIAWSPDGTRMAVGYRYGDIELWDPMRGERLQTLWEPELEHAAFGWGSPDNPMDSQIFSYIPLLIPSLINLTGVAWSPDGSMLATISDGDVITLWDAGGGEALQTLEGHTDSVTAIDWSPDGRLLASGSLDNTIHLWLTLPSGAEAEPLRTLEEHATNVKLVSFSPDETVLASSDGSKIVLWEPSSGDVLRTIEDPSEDVTSITWSPDGTLLATGSGEGTLIIWDPFVRFPELHTLEGAGGAVLAVSWSPDGNVLAFGSEDGSVTLINPDTIEILHTLEGHVHSITSIAWSPDGDFVASGSTDGTIIVWDLRE